jgi:cupin superfamily acireductone dioxygenase involved in methionine salvage
VKKCNSLNQPSLLQVTQHTTWIALRVQVNCLVVVPKNVPVWNEVTSSNSLDNVFFGRSKPRYPWKYSTQCQFIHQKSHKNSLKFEHKKVKQSHYRPGVAQRVPGS